MKKKILSLLVIMALMLTAVPSVGVNAATKKQSIKATKTTLMANKTTKITWKNAPKSIKKSKVKWKSSNTYVATVKYSSKKKAKVTAKHAGTAKITLTYNGKKVGTTTINVKPIVKTFVPNKYRATMNINGKATIAMTVKLNDKSKSKGFTVKSKNASIATATVSGNNVIITGKKKGTTTVTITSKADANVTASIKVTVNATPNKNTNNTNNNHNGGNNNTNSGTSDKNDDTEKETPTTPVYPPIPNDNTKFYDENEGCVDVSYIGTNTCISLDATKKYNGVNDGIYIDTTSYSIYPDSTTVKSSDYHVVWVDVTKYPDYSIAWLRPVNEGTATISFKDKNNGKMYSFKINVTGCNHTYYDYFVWRDNIVNTIKDMNDYDKVRYVQDMLINDFTYAPFAASKWGAPTKKLNCHGGTNAFIDICEQFGLKAKGIVVDGKAHTQALVQYNNGEIWRVAVTPGETPDYAIWTHGWDCEQVWDFY